MSPSLVSALAPPLLLAVPLLAAPALRLEVADADLRYHGELTLVVESADGLPHRALLRVLTPPELRAHPAALEADVPASGPLRLRVRLFRGEARWGSRHDVFVQGRVAGGPERPALLAGARVEVAPDPAWLPRRRALLAALAAALIAGSALLEGRAGRAA